MEDSLRAISNLLVDIALQIKNNGRIPSQKPYRMVSRFRFPIVSGIEPEKLQPIRFLECKKKRINYRDLKHKLSMYELIL
jgi:hypothetical protein